MSGFKTMVSGEGRATAGILMVYGILNGHWFKFHSGDGFYTAVDPSDWTTVYSERQGGMIFRNHALFRQQSVNITPDMNNTINWGEVVPKQSDPERLYRMKLTVNGIIYESFVTIREDPMLVR